MTTSYRGFRGRLMSSLFRIPLHHLLATFLLLSIATEDQFVASAHSGVAAEVEIDPDGTTTTSTARDAQRTTDGVADGGGNGEGNVVDDDLFLFPPLLGALFGGETASPSSKSSPHASEDDGAGKFPIIPALVDAWESHPLLATSRPPPPPADCETDTDPKDDENGGFPPPTAISNIPTVRRSSKDPGAMIDKMLDLRGDSPTASDGTRPLLGLGVDEVFTTILSRPNLEHGLGKDFTILKKIVRDGQEWSGVVPKDQIPADEARGAISKYGFSLVINRLEERWDAVERFARALEGETLPGSISCNLYLTPGASTSNPADDGNGDGAIGRMSGFEVHYDWMDVVVLQISGEKTWTVASSPLTYLSTSDLKRKPTPKEIRAYAHGDGTPSRYEDFVLRPGDVLYIPRGFMHNASTVDYADEPSLHLTFGLEHHCRTTVEALVHYALLLFYGVGDGDDGDGTTDHRVAVPGDECSSGTGTGVTWLDMLDMSVADVVRRDCDKAKPGATLVPQLDRGCGMRRSVPLHPAWRRMLGGRERNDDVIWKMYTDGLDAYRKSADLGGAIGYPKFLRVSPDIREKFCLPTRDAGGAIDAILACEKALPRFVSEERFVEEVERFHSWARDRERLKDALEAFERGATARRVKLWDDKEEALKKAVVGHGRYASS